MFKKIFMAVLAVGLMASYALADDAAEKIIPVCVSDEYGYHWDLDISNQSPYGITGVVHNTGCSPDHTVTGNATGKNGDVITATTLSTTTDYDCCSWRSYWSVNAKTKTGTYTWQQLNGPNPYCGSSGGPTNASVVRCSLADEEAATGAGPGTPSAE
ncbi:MAG: hypothetical protein HY880_04305 [Deltaproteobacteria bacterium]|nr:hypothetical protein [Deltaproteobacteria bacterium]